MIFDIFINKLSLFSSLKQLYLNSIHVWRLIKERCTLECIIILVLNLVCTSFPNYFVHVVFAVAISVLDGTIILEKLCKERSTTWAIRITPAYFKFIISNRRVIKLRHSYVLSIVTFLFAVLNFIKYSWYSLWLNYDLVAHRILRPWFGKFTAVTTLERKSA